MYGWLCNLWSYKDEHYSYQIIKWSEEEYQEGDEEVNSKANCSSHSYYLVFGLDAWENGQPARIPAHQSAQMSRQINCAIQAHQHRNDCDDADDAA